VHLIILAAHVPEAAATGSQISTIIAILAGAVIVLGGLVALVKAIWKISTVLRDNIHATEKLASKTDELATKMETLTTVVDGRISSLEQRMNSLGDISNRMTQLEGVILSGGRGATPGSPPP